MYSIGISFKKKIVLAILFVFLFLPNYSSAQCAGEDNSIAICDYANPLNQSIDLFSLLNGTPSPGGTWTDTFHTGALNTSTGILNVWDIHISGIYTFLYTVNNVTGCSDNTAVITITVGGYSGVTSPDASACSDDEEVNLFQFFDGSMPNPQLNGYWTDDSSTGALSDNIFNAKQAGVGVYSFTYVMPAIGSCPAMSSTAMVTVYRVPFPGIPARVLICDTFDFSQVTNLDLFTLLAGPDPNGQWSESGTSELSDPYDSFINLQNVYNTFGAGKYYFSYTVFPTNPVCQKKTATIEFVIEHLLDFTGATFVVNSDICENEIGSATYTAVLNEGFLPIPDATYKVEYTITGHTGIIVATANFANGVLTFPINANYFPAVGAYTVTITEIYDVTSERACDNIIDVSDVLNIFPLPRINAATLTIAPICQNSDVTVLFSGTSNLTDGNYEITYNLSGSNTLASQVITVAVLNGLFDFTILAPLLPNVGNTTIRITHIKNLQTGCENDSTLTKVFVINGSPNVLAFTATVSDVCKNQPVFVSLSGLNILSNITINYNLTGANTAINQTEIIIVNSGNASFVIPTTLLPNLGTTTITITDLINNVTLCGTSLSNASDSFLIIDIPNPPTASNVEFCKTENATVANLNPNGSQYNWYNSLTSTIPLSNNELLISGNYFVSENNSSGCSSERSMISAIINALEPPILNTDGQKFCGVNKPTLQDLTNNLTTTNEIIWFDASTGGNLLPNSQLLQERITYYGFGFSATTQCYSEAWLSVTVSLLDCDEVVYDFFIPDGFSPNADGANDTFRIPGIEFLYPDYELEIYNRYGTLLFKGNNYQPQWDGKSTEDTNGFDGIAANGIYFYILYFNKNNKSPQQGRLYLNR
jgi:gliding motility-associated-like protein